MPWLARKAEKPVIYSYACVTVEPENLGELGLNLRTSPKPIRNMPSCRGDSSTGLEQLMFAVFRMPPHAAWHVQFDPK